MKVCGEFHTFVKPTAEKQITQYCTDKTGITNNHCFAKKVPTFVQALDSLHTFFMKNRLFDSEFVFVSSGDVEGSQMFQESTFLNLEMANYHNRWINLKKVFPINELPKDPSQMD
jgi:inhibitor of KinA sporulation pathway (predicted exonuclease)